MERKFKPYRSFVPLLSSCFFSLFLIGFLVFITSCYSEEDILGFIITSFVFLIVGVVGLRKFLWLSIGREILILEEDKLSVLRKGSFMTKDIIIYKKDLLEVKQIEDTPDEFASKAKKMIYARTNNIRRIKQMIMNFYGEGRMIIKLKNNNSHQIFSGINSFELKETISFIEEWKGSLVNKPSSR